MEARRLDELFLSDAWLRRIGTRREAGIKIHEDVRVVEGALKAPGGLVRVTATLRDHRVDDAWFSGDFTLLPAEGVGALEAAVRGVALEVAPLAERLETVYRELAISSPGLEPAHFAEAIVQAAGG